MHVILEWLLPDGSHERFLVSPEQRFRVGRRGPAECVISGDSELSGQHFQVTVTPDGCLLEDLDSLNGTWVNGVTVSRTPLNHGDEIGAGQSEFRVYFEQDEPVDVVRADGREPDRQTASEADPTFFNPRNPRLRQAIEHAGVRAQQLPDVLRGAPGQRLYALLDAARSEHAPLQMLIDSGERFQTLYEGESARDLAWVAPYLVELPPACRLLERLIEDGWGASWGLFLRSDETFTEVRRHFRHFLLVKLEEDEQEVYFRFYDPRVLRAYLPTCTFGEIKQFFGPVASYLMEDESPDLLLRFHLNAEGDFPEKIPLAW